MEHRKTYRDYQKVYRAISGAQEARVQIREEYGVNTMDDLHGLGLRLYRGLTQEEKDMDRTQAELSMRPLDQTRRETIMN